MIKIIIILGLTLVVTACSATTPANPSSPEFNKPPAITTVESDYLFEIKDMDTLISLSDHIVLGEVTMTQTFNESTQKTTVNILEDYKGKLAPGSLISVYDNSGELKAGEQVLLFLEQYDSTYYPEAIYSPVGEVGLVRLEGETILTESQLLEDIENIDQLIAYIQQSSLLESKREPVTVLDSVASVDELVAASDAIIELIPTGRNAVGAQVSNFTFDVVRTFKGSMAELEFINLPSSITVGETYLVFMKSYRENSLSLTTRYGSLLHSSDEAWDATVRALEPLQ